jgi:shikimate dehydrogenase
MPRLAVLGQPVSHSRSPAMQNAALAELGLAPRWSYEAIEVAPEHFSDLVRALPDDGFAGVNVTVPHKRTALAVADRASAAATTIGAANTLSYEGREIVAENTDAVGLIEALPESPAGMRVLVLGAGGSARAAAWALDEAGAHVSVWNRTPSKAAALLADLGLGEGRRVTNDEVELERFDAYINCTTVGLAEAAQPPAPVRHLAALPISIEDLDESKLVVDLVYGSFPTSLVTAAGERGARVVDGLEVLVHQGAASLRIWTGLEAPRETMRRAARGG